MSTLNQNLTDPTIAFVTQHLRECLNRNGQVLYVHHRLVPTTSWAQAPGDLLLTEFAQALNGHHSLLGPFPWYAWTKNVTAFGHTAAYDGHMLIDTDQMPSVIEYLPVVREQWARTMGITDELIARFECPIGGHAVPGTVCIERTVAEFGDHAASCCLWFRSR